MRHWPAAPMTGGYRSSSCSKVDQRALGWSALASFVHVGVGLVRVVSPYRKVRLASASTARPRGKWGGSPVCLQVSGRAESHPRPLTWLLGNGHWPGTRRRALAATAPNRGGYGHRQSGDRPDEIRLLAQLIAPGLGIGVVRGLGDGPIALRPDLVVALQSGPAAPSGSTSLRAPLSRLARAQRPRGSRTSPSTVPMCRTPASRRSGSTQPARIGCLGRCARRLVRTLVRTLSGSTATPGS